MLRFRFTQDSPDRDFKMKLAALLLAVAPLVSTAVMAAEQSRTLIANSVYCFKNGDWSDMVEASADRDEDAVMQLVNAGKCRMVTKAMKVMMVEPEEGGVGALILLPSGKTALTTEHFLRR